MPQVDTKQMLKQIPQRHQLNNEPEYRQYHNRTGDKKALEWQATGNHKIV